MGLGPMKVHAISGGKKLAGVVSTWHFRYCSGILKVCVSSKITCVKEVPEESLNYGIWESYNKMFLFAILLRVLLLV